MKKILIFLGVTFLVATWMPVSGATRLHMVGLGLTGGRVDNDEFIDEFEFEGVSIFGKIGFTKNWGLMLTIRTMEDDEDFSSGAELEYDQLAVHAVYMWRPEMKVRPHVKGGIAFTDFEGSDFPGAGNFSDDGAGLSIGGGLEAGSEQVAFFGDYDITVVELFDEDTTFANVTLGIVFRF